MLRLEKDNVVGENKRGVRLIVVAGRTQGTPLPVCGIGTSPSARSVVVVDRWGRWVAVVVWWFVMQRSADSVARAARRKIGDLGVNIDVWG